MTKVQLLKEILQRAGDPNAESDTFRSLAWSLFLESLYEQADNLRLVEDKSLVKTVTLAVITGLNGVGLVNERSGFFDTIAEIKDIFILNDSHNIPVARASDEEYRLMLSNPFICQPR